jgi:site-specific DNA-cytosine methylase
VDFSPLNNHKKPLESLGESGDTFYGMIGYSNFKRPKCIILENVEGAPWLSWTGLKRSVDIDKLTGQSIEAHMNEIGYRVVLLKANTRNYYLPQTRVRGYMVCIDERLFITSRNIQDQKALLKDAEAYRTDEEVEEEFSQLVALIDELLKKKGASKGKKLDQDDKYRLDFLQNLHKTHESKPRASVLLALCRMFFATKKVDEKSSVLLKTYENILSQIDVSKVPSELMKVYQELSVKLDKKREVDQKMSDLLNACHQMFEGLAFPASAPVEAMLLQNDDPLLRAVAMQTGSASNAIAWSKCKAGHEDYRRQLGLGKGREMTHWSADGPLRNHDYFIYFPGQKERVSDTIDVSHLRNLRRGFDDRYFK